MFYYYKIENLINHNMYIGITTDPDARRKRHFNLLKNNVHFNPYLQNAYNKFGKDNFCFLIIETLDTIDIEKAYQHEAELINQYDSFNNGYNCNPGGKWTGSGGKFTKQEIFYIKSACHFEKQVTGILAEIFNCAQATIENIRIGRNYKPYCLEFDLLSNEDKEAIYNDFCDLTQFSILKFKRNSKKRSLSKEQVMAILLNDEFRYTTFAHLRDAFNIGGDHRNTFQRIRNGSTYKECYQEYKTYTLMQKQEMLCRYKEIYNVKPV